MLKPDQRALLEEASRRAKERMAIAMTSEERVEFDTIVDDITKRFYNLGIKHGREQAASECE